MAGRTLFLGVDGGDSTTVAIVVDESGCVVSVGRAGCSNHQTIGERAACRELKVAIDVALRGAEAKLSDIAAAGFGLEGADRESEMALVQAMVEASAPVPLRFVENHAVSVLRAATKDAVGVALVAGTSTNCVGRDRYGRRLQVGGYGAVSGDVGHGEDLAMRTVGAAWMASDGRTAPSSLARAVPTILGVPSVEQIPGRLVRGVLPEPLVDKLVRCLFFEAERGDGLACRIVEDTGERLGAAASAVMRQLVLRGSNAVVVLGGAIFDSPEHRLLVEATERKIRRSVSEAHVIVLRIQPVIGAVLFARDLLGHAPLHFATRLRAESERIHELSAIV